ncbi:hypothetical protein ACFQ3C_09235 [Seohaeicola saemankumensis]|uniref:Uncharacterized protein n=1 Tax=Seohaeicola saemankumensis TaxID=481181 RepID=A0ABW3TEE6_9RHOB
METGKRAEKGHFFLLKISMNPVCTAGFRDARCPFRCGQASENLIISNLFQPFVPKIIKFVPFAFDQIYGCNNTGAKARVMTR